IANYMLEAARSLGRNDAEIMEQIRYADEQGQLLDSVLGGNSEGAASIRHADTATDIRLQAARMYMRDNMQKVHIKGASMSEEDFLPTVAALRKRGEDRFNRHWAKKLGKNWQD